MNMKKKERKRWCTDTNGKNNLFINRWICKGKKHFITM